MSTHNKIPVVMRNALIKYTDIRDELEDFYTFIQDACSDIGGVIEEIDDQLEMLQDRMFHYNEAVEMYNYMTGRYPLGSSPLVCSVDEEEELPSPLREASV